MPVFLSVITWMETHCLWTSKTVRKFYFMCVECHLKQKVRHTQKLLRRKVAKGWCKVDGALDDRELCKAWTLTLQVEARSGRPWMPKWWGLDIIIRHWGPVEEFLSENTSAGGVWLLFGMAQSILKEISPGISLEGMMLKLKLHYFGHLMRRVDSLEKTLMLGGIGGRRRRRRWGWDGWMASLTRWMWIWVNSGSWWWTGRPGVLRFIGWQRVGHDWATEVNWKQYPVSFSPLLLAMLYYQI